IDILLSSIIPRPPRPTLFPYTTLFRSHDPERGVRGVDVNDEIDVAPGAALHQSKLAGIAVAIAVQVVPKAKARLCVLRAAQRPQDRKSTRLNSSHLGISYAVFCLKKKN